MGRPTFTAEQRLLIAEDLGIIVDEQDMWLLSAFTWMKATNGYIRTWWKGKTYPFHHFVVGVPLFGMDVDHINRIRHDNRRSNLRIVSRSENNLNTIRSLNTQNIYTCADGYRVCIQRDGVQHQRTRKTLEEAILVRDELLHALAG